MEGRRRKARGTGVMVGFVETYNRPLTIQAIGDLEVIPHKKIQYKGVVRFGDTVHLRLTVAEKKETSKPDRGIVFFDAQVLNQDGQAVQEGRWTLMMRRAAC